MPEFKNRKEYEDYFDKKYAAGLKTALTKLAAVQAELANARQKFAVNPPQGLPEDEVAEFTKLKADCVKMFGLCDRYLAQAKSAGEQMSTAFKRRGA